MQTLSARIAGRLAALLGTLAVTACADRAPTDPTLAPAGSAPAPAAPGHATGHSALEGAIAGQPAGVVPQISAVTGFGASSQVAASTIRSGGFPRMGDSYVVVSSGDAARYTTTGDVDAGTGCVDSRCDVGGVEFTLTLPRNATTIEVEYRYFSWDDEPSRDAFRIRFLPGAAPEGGTVPPAGCDGNAGCWEYSIHTEMDDGSAPAYGSFRWGKELRRLSIRVGAYAEQQVRLRFEASDDANPRFDSGVAIDNLRVYTNDANDRQAPRLGAMAVDPSPVPVNTASTVTVPVDDGSTGNSAIGGGEFIVDNATWLAMSVAGSGSSATLSGSVPATSSTGVRVLCARGYDILGNVSDPQCMEQAVYQPTQGNVSASGAYLSRPGAYLPDYSLEGRATFGLHTKTKPRSNTTSAKLRFVVVAGALEFQSRSIDYVVINGTRADVRGRGMLYVNGVPGLQQNRDGDYSYLFVGLDEVRDRRPHDRLRLKIWETKSGTLVYDSQRGETGSQDLWGDSATPLTDPASGGVVIRK